MPLKSDVEDDPDIINVDEVGSSGDKLLVDETDEGEIDGRFEDPERGVSALDDLRETSGSSFTLVSSSIFTIYLQSPLSWIPLRCLPYLLTLEQ